MCMWESNAASWQRRSAAAPQRRSAAAPQRRSPVALASSDRSTVGCWAGSTSSREAPEPLWPPGGCGTTAVGARQHARCRTVPFQVKLHHRVDMPRRLALCTYLAGGAVARQHSQKRKTMGGGTPATPATSGQEVPRMEPLPPPSAGAAGAAGAAGDALLGVADVDIDGGERMEVAAAAVEAVEAAPAPAVEVAAAEVAAAVAAAGGGAAGGGAAGASSEDDGLTYELFSVLVHAGTANAGHYYAYIKVALTLTMPLTLPRP